MTVYFSHGKKHGPQDPKILWLISIAAQHGLKICNVDSRHIKSPDERLKHLTQLIKDEEENEFILVGSSMGGYVSLLASDQKKPKGLFLLAPAFYINGYQRQDLPSLQLDYFEIVHGKQDTVVPVDNSIRYSNAHTCQLHLIETNHSFSNALEEIGALLNNFIKRIN